jgi:hypothetical protein
MARYLVLLAVAIAAHAQGTTPKASATEYPVHVKSGLNEIGAEYMVHSFSAGEQMYVAEKYLVVEVALFPPKGKSVKVEASKFSLRVNGKKPLAVQNPAMVAASLKHQGWLSRHGLDGGIGLPGIGGGMGGPRTQSPFPGGPDPNRLPEPPRAPGGDSNTPHKDELNPEELLMKTALPEGNFDGPVSGFLYFPWTGKASAIKSIDLMYDDLKITLR